MKKKDPYYERPDKEFVQRYKRKGNNWTDSGWISLGISGIFLIISLVRFIKGLNVGDNLSLGLMFLFISIISLFIGYKKKFS